MAKNDNLGDFLKSLADKFRSKLSTTASINPQDFEGKIDEVYNKGFNEGGSAGYGQGYLAGESAGKKEEYNTFWDNYQSNGSRTHYSGAFSGKGWNNATFKPKYDIVINNCTEYGIFYNSKITGSLQDILDAQGITFTINLTDSLSQTTYNCSYFGYSSFSELPVLDFSTRTGDYVLYGMFKHCPNLEKIEKIILPANHNGYGSFAFYACNKLKEIRFEGTIINTLEFHYCPLSADSVNNILNCLDTATYSGTRTITLKTTSKTAYNDKYGDWNERIAQLTTSGNWTFTLS